MLHQLKRNCNSTNVSLNCSKISQWIFEILAILELRLVTSFMGVSKTIFFREISCCSVRERSQRLRPFRVPKNCCISLSFFLVMVAHPILWPISSIAAERDPSFYDKQAGKINCPRPFLRGYGSLRVVHWVTRSWQGPHPVSWSQDQRPHQFLHCWSSMSPSKVHFLSRFLVLRAIPSWWDHDWHLGCAIRQRIDSFFWISEPKMSVLDCLGMEFRFQVHGCQATCTTSPSMTGPIIVSPRISCMGSGLWVYSRMCVCVLGILGWNLEHRRPRQEWSCSSYLPIPCTRTMRLSKPLWTESSRTVIRCPECFSRKMFPDTSLGEDIKRFTSCEFTLQYFFVYEFYFFESSFLSLFVFCQTELRTTTSKLLCR